MKNVEEVLRKAWANVRQIFLHNDYRVSIVRNQVERLENLCKGSKLYSGELDVIAMAISGVIQPNVQTLPSKNNKVNINAENDV